MAACPECGSKDISAAQRATVNWGRAVGGWLLFGPLGGAVGALTGENTQNVLCLDCGTAWSPRELRGTLQIIHNHTGRELDLAQKSDRVYLKDFLRVIEPLIKAGEEEEKKIKDLQKKASLGTKIAKIDSRINATRSKLEWISDQLAANQASSPGLGSEPTPNPSPPAASAPKTAGNAPPAPSGGCLGNGCLLSVFLFFGGLILGFLNPLLIGICILLPILGGLVDGSNPPEPKKPSSRTYRGNVPVRTLMREERFKYRQECLRLQEYKEEELARLEDERSRLEAEKDALLENAEIIRSAARERFDDALRKFIATHE